MSKKITDFKQTRNGPGVVTYHLNNGVNVVFVNTFTIASEVVKLVQLYRDDGKVISLTYNEIDIIQKHAKNYFKKEPR